MCGQQNSEDPNLNPMAGDAITWGWYTYMPAIPFLPEFSHFLSQKVAKNWNVPFFYIFEGEKKSLKQKKKIRLKLTGEFYVRQIQK